MEIDDGLSFHGYSAPLVYTFGKPDCAPNSPLSSVSGNTFLQKMINCKEFPIHSRLPLKIHDNLIVHYSFGTFLDGKWLMSFVYLDSFLKYNIRGLNLTQ